MQKKKIRLWARNRQSNSCESQHSRAKERRSPGATHMKGELSLRTAMPQVMEKSERRVRGGPKQRLWRASPHLGATSKHHNHHPALVSSGSRRDVEGQLQELQVLAGTGQSSAAKESKARPFFEGRKNLRGPYFHWAAPPAPARRAGPRRCSRCRPG